jgi:hypothetical protein
MSGTVGSGNIHQSHCQCATCRQLRVWHAQGQQQASPQQINQLYGAQLGGQMGNIVGVAPYQSGLEQMAQQLNPGPVAGDVDHMKVAEKLAGEPLEIEYKPESTLRYLLEWICQRLNIRLRY